MVNHDISYVIARLKVYIPLLELNICMDSVPWDRSRNNNLIHYHIQVFDSESIVNMKIYRNHSGERYKILLKLCWRKNSDPIIFGWFCVIKFHINPLSILALSSPKSEAHQIRVFANYNKTESQEEANIST